MEVNLDNFQLYLYSCFVDYVFKSKFKFLTVQTYSNSFRMQFMSPEPVVLYILPCNQSIGSVEIVKMNK